MSLPVKQYVKKVINFFRKLNSQVAQNDVICERCNSCLMELFARLDYNRHHCEVFLTANNGVQTSCIEELQKILQGAKYSCKYSARGCDFYGFPIEDHESKCSYNMICICNQTVLDKNALVEHFRNDHYMQSILLTKPMAEITIEYFPLVGILPYNLYIGNTSVIVLLCTDTKSENVSVIAYNATDIPRQMNFTLKFAKDGVEYCSHGKVTENLDVSMEAKTKVNIPGFSLTPRNMPISIKIYFENYESIEPFDDYFHSLAKEFQCPVCFHTIADSFYQCSNGHNICTACKAKIDTCPVCRDTGYFQLKMKSLAVQLQRPCTYADRGCFRYSMESEMVEHEKMCPMKTIECDLCANITFNKTAYIKHMICEHKMQILDLMPAEITPGFVMFKGRVFEFSFCAGRAEVGPLLKYTWYLRLMYTSEPATSYDFKLEFKREGGNAFTIKDKTQLDKTQQSIIFNADTSNNANITHILTLL